MQRVIINMQSYVMSDAIKMALSNSGDLAVTVVNKPEEVASKCFTHAADAVIMEVTARAPWEMAERLKTREKIKKKCPNCKIALLVDENSEGKIAEQVQQAKLDGLIDQFIYGSISASYLVALVKTL